MDIKQEWKNKKYKISSYIKGFSIGKNAKGALWTRVDDEGFFQNDAYNEKVIISSDWRKFEIIGNIDSTSSKLYFGAFVQNNGTFYFDDFELEIQNGKKEWKSIPIANHSFENSTDNNWTEGVDTKRPTHVSNFVIDYTDKEYFKGNHSLVIEGKNIIGNNENGKFAKINDVDLYYEVYGEGEPLILIHGNGQSISSFINQVDVLSKYYRVVLVDSRGRGNSTYNEDVELTYNLQADDIKLFLDYLKIDQAHIVGWSDGAIIGLIVGMKYPEKIEKLVSMAANIFPEGAKDDILNEVKEAIPYLEKQGTNNITLDLYKLLANYPQYKFEDLKAIKAKTLIVAGDHDVIKNSHTVNIFENIKDAQLAILPNETHYLPAENPDLFNRIVLEFLSSKE